MEEVHTRYLKNEENFFFQYTDFSVPVILYKKNHFLLPLLLLKKDGLSNKFNAKNSQSLN